MMYNENSQQWGSSFEFNINPQEPITSPHIMTKVDELSQKIDAFMKFGQHHHLPTFCAICSNSDHSTHSCPYNTSFPEFREDQNFHRPSYNNHYSDTSNLGWASHPN